MTAKITHDQKEAAIEALREHGTMQYAAKISGVTVRTLNLEMTRSAIFKRRILEAREEGKRNIADKAVELIKNYAYGENKEKTDRNRLTAAIALANAYEPGFRGTTQMQGRIEHDIKVITAVPRPKYYEIEEPSVASDKKLGLKVRSDDEPKIKLLDKGGKKPHNIEDIIEGEILNEVG